MPRRSLDWVDWRIYRRAWIPAVLAAILVLATSFRPLDTAQTDLPPGFTNHQAVQLLHEARAFSNEFPNRRAGTDGANESASAVRDQLRDAGLKVRTVPTTTRSPRTNQTLSLVNVEGVLRGRTPETVVIYAHRDNLGRAPKGQPDTGDPVGTMALVELAKDLAATRDRRRTYLFVSTDGALVNGAGTRRLANELQSRPGGVLAAIGLDRPGSGQRTLHVVATPAGRATPPLGLDLAARAAVATEGGNGFPSSWPRQLLRLATPITLNEHGQLLERGIPALTVSGADERVHGFRAAPSTQRVGGAMRAVQRLVGTLDSVDALQSAGKTHIVTRHRVYRGWAIKLLLASLLLPPWVLVADALTRHRRRWNLFAALGSATRAMLAGLASVTTLWLVNATALLPQTGDRPPDPTAVGGLHLPGVTIWVAGTCTAWLLARGPDWRRTARGTIAPHATAQRGDILVGTALLCVLSACALAANPYATIFALPALHAFPWLASRRIHAVRWRVAVWAVGGLGPLLAMLSIGSFMDTGLSTPWYSFVLIETRTLPPGLGLVMFMGAALGGYVLLASLGQLGAPLLPRLRAGALTPSMPRIVRPRIARSPSQPRRTRTGVAAGSSRPATSETRARSRERNRRRSTPPRPRR